MEKALFILIVLSFPAAVSFCVFGIIWFFCRRIIVWKLYLALWGIILGLLVFQFTAANFANPRDKIYQYTSIYLSKDSKILQKYYDLDSMDFGCAFELQLSAQDLEKMKSLFTFHSSFGSAIDRVPKNWTVSKDVELVKLHKNYDGCLLYTSPSPRDGLLSRMPSSA